MRVLVLGASGYIGLPVSQALVRAGYVVYGLTRSEEKAKQLAAEEITPIVGNPTDASTWGHLVATLDAVIDTVGGWDIHHLAAASYAAVRTAALARPAGAPKLTYILTTGTWVHGEDRTTVVTDTTPISAPTAFSAWRVPLEQQVVRDAALSGIVVRPGVVYGRAGGPLARVFADARAGKVQWFGARGARMMMVHQDDLAELYVRAAERGALVAGRIFDGVNGRTEATDDLLLKLAQVAGAGAPEYVETDNAFWKAMGTTTLIRPYLGRTLLGWEPRKPGFVDGLEVYYAAWKASVGA